MIFFDEAGNTGDNILDPEQPYYTMASHDFSESETKEILRPLLRITGDREIHFKDLRKYGKYHDAIVECIDNPQIGFDRIFSFVALKEFMVVIQIVEYVIETFSYHIGVDIHKEGRNIIIANEFFSLGNGLWDKSLYKSLLDSFNKWGRKKVKAAEFYESVRLLLNTLDQKPGHELIGSIWMSRFRTDSISKIFEKYAFDPTLPIFVSLCSQWGKSYQKKFHVIFDESKAIDYWMGMINFLSNLPPETVGYGRLQHTYPLLIDKIDSRSSDSCLQLQLADLFASSINFFMKHRQRLEFEPLALKIANTRLLQTKGNSLLPNNKFTPEEINMKGANQGIHPLNFLAEQISQKPDAIQRINSTKK